MRHGIHEIIKAVAEAESRADKVALLRANAGPALYAVLKHAYDPGIRWLLPEGNPPYKELPKDQLINAELMLLKEARTFYMFVEGGLEPSGHISPAKREQKFVELLEAVHPEDAKVLLHMKNRTIPGVDKMTVAEAFPGLIGDIALTEKVADVVSTVNDKVARANARRRERGRLRREVAQAAKAAQQPDQQSQE